MYAADKRENKRNSTFFAFYQAVVCRLLIFQGITQWHFCFFTFQKITWEIHYHSSHADIFIFRKFDCKAQIKMREILFFAEHKVVPLVY